MDISIIIPVYNSQKFLRRCLDSVLSQINISKEIILVDDGSNDNSPFICDEYAKHFKSVKVVHTKNGGPGTAKNIGYDLAIGTYVAFIDSDDEIKEDMFCTMLESGYRNHADIVCCNYIQVDEWGNMSHIEYTDREYVLNRDDALKAILVKDKIYSQCWTKIYLRKTMDENSVRNPEGFKTDEDFIFNIQAFACSKIVCVVDRPLYIYTHRMSSLSKDYYKSHIIQYMDNRIVRLEMVEKIIHSKFPYLQEYSTYHCLFYYNELLGRISLYPSLFKQEKVRYVLLYMRRHYSLLKKYHKSLGFSKIGLILIKYLPITLYLYYRRCQSNK